MACLDDDSLFALSVGRADPAAMDGIDQHLDRCAPCRQTLARLVTLNTAASLSGGGGGAREEALGPGTAVGRYRIQEILGAGAMGAVYAAHDPELDRTVCLKLLHPSASDAEGRARARLLREAQALARLSHPNVVAVHDVGAHGDECFFAMERVEGQTLRSWLLQPRTRDAVVERLVMAGEGLAAAHQAGVVHGDFKPENVLLSVDGRARVSDFGLSRLTSAARDAAGSREVSGTPAYMAPELFRGQVGDAASDQFSFCVTAYEALCGARPFPADARRAPPQLSAEAVRRLERHPRWLSRPLLRGLCAQPEARFASMRALLDALSRGRLRARQRRWTLAAGVTLAALGALAVTLRPPAVDRCAAGNARLAGAWDAERRGALERAFGAAGAPLWPRVSSALDRYADGWLRMHREACEATHVHHAQSPEALALRMVCLDDRRRDLEAFTALLLRTDDATRRGAERVVGGLPPVATCGDARQLALIRRPTLDPAAQLRHQRIQQALSEGSARMYAGQFDQAAALAAPALVEARALKAHAEAAELLLMTAFVHGARSKLSESEADLREAVVEAQAAGHLYAVAQGWSRLAQNLFLQRRFEEGEQLARHALGALEAVDAPAMRVKFLAVLGRAYADRSRFPEAERSLKQALALAQDVSEDRERLLTECRVSLAGVVMMQGKFARTLELLQPVLAFTRRVRGPSHPEMLTPLYYSGQALVGAGRLAEGEAVARQALELAKAMGGARAPFLSGLFYVLGFALVEQGRCAEALAAAEEGLEVISARKDSGAMPVELRTVQGMALRCLGRPREAQAQLALAGSSADELLGPGSQESLLAGRTLSEVWAERGQPTRALALAQRVLLHSERLFGRESCFAADALRTVGWAKEKGGRLGEAEAAYAEAAAIGARTLGPEHPHVRAAEAGLARVRSLGRRASARLLPGPATADLRRP